MPTPKHRFSDNTYSLAKGVHHINIAKQYFEDVRYGTVAEVKAIFNQYIQKCDWIIANMRDRLTPENRNLILKELDDSFAIEAINDKLIHLTPEQKEVVEQLIDSMIAGEEIAVEKID